MSRKDYKLIANLLYRGWRYFPQGDPTSVKNYADLILDFTNAFERDNPRFDVKKFTNAAYFGR
jgi:hypothetical protein